MTDRLKDLLNTFNGYYDWSHLDIEEKIELMADILRELIKGNQDE